MAISEEHFLGFDPTRGADQLPACPLNPFAATLLWYEKWIFTSWSFGHTHSTGIIYSHAFVVFDVAGNVLDPAPGTGRTKCGFSGSETCTDVEKCKSFDDWLSYARAVCAKDDLPPPGTIELVESFAAVIGRRHAS